MHIGRGVLGDGLQEQARANVQVHTFLVTVNPQTILGKRHGGHGESQRLGQSTALLVNPAYRPLASPPSYCSLSGILAMGPFAVAKVKPCERNEEPLLALPVIIIYDGRTGGGGQVRRQRVDLALDNGEWGGTER